MERAQAAQVIPDTGKSTRAGDAISGAVMAMPVASSGGHFVSQATDGVGQDLGFYQVRIVFDRRASPLKIDGGLCDTPRGCEFPFDSAGAIGAGHTMDGQVKRLSCHIHMMLPERGRRHEWLGENSADRQFVGTEGCERDRVAHEVNDHGAIPVNGRDASLILVDNPELESTVSKANSRPLAQIQLSV
jgi:hypothetical protein